MEHQLEPFVNAKEIEYRVNQLAREISDSFSDVQKKHDFRVLVTMRGAMVFASDLIRALWCEGIRSKLDFVNPAVYSDRDGSFEIDTKFISSQIVLVVDDILDSGRTLHKLVEECRGSCVTKTVVLIDKTDGRCDAHWEFKADYVGFSMEGNDWVVGYGMDFEEEYRSMPGISIVRRSQ